MGLTKIVSGGQTGVDTGALLAANALGLETGGWAPLGWLTEDGPQEEFMLRMGLKECPRAGYPARTEMNVRDSDGTLILFNTGALEGGTYDTDCCASSMDKPTYYARIVLENFKLIEVPTNTGWTRSHSHMSLTSWINLMGIQTLNVAGPRQSKWPRGCELACSYLIEQLS